MALPGTWMQDCKPGQTLHELLGLLVSGIASGQNLLNDPKSLIILQVGTMKKLAMVKTQNLLHQEM